MTLGEVNDLDRGAFVAALGWIFEHSPWVAEHAWESRPFGSVEALHAIMVGAVEAASEDERLALIRAHPDLGERAKMSDASVGEQAGAGLDRLTAGEYARLQELNAAYRGKFGFPFIFAVKGAGKYDILRAIEERLRCPAAAETATAIEQIARIARFRLADFIEEKT